MFLLVLVALPVASWFFVFAPRAEQVAEVEAEIKQKQAKLEQLENATAAMDNLGEEIDKLTQAIQVFEQKLPAQHEVDVILKEVWELAAKHDLAPKSVRPEKIMSAAYYTELPIKMEIVGDFDGFYSFLLELEKLQRITRMPNMKLEKIKDEEGMMKAVVILSIFFEGEGQTSAAAGGKTSTSGERRI